MNLLFDVHCAGTYLGSKAEIDKEHSVKCIVQDKELPGDIEDPEIIRIAHDQDYTIVTKDIDMVKLALSKNAKVAVLKGNHIFLIDKAIKIIGREPQKDMFSQN